MLSFSKGIVIKSIIVFSCFIYFSACKTAQFNPHTAFWGEIIADTNYIYPKNNIIADIVGNLDAGSIVLFGEPVGDFHEVYLSKSTTYNTDKKKRYYIYKPKYNRLEFYSPLDFNRQVIVSPGGDYETKYIRSISRSAHSYSNYGSSTGTIHVKGHYRTSKSGKRTYVRPHTRSRH